MVLIRESENAYDRFAVNIRGPQLHEVLHLLWDAETKPMPNEKTVSCGKSLD